MKLLLIEDEQELLNSVTEYLKEEGYVIETASNFRQACEKISLYEYDCALVDITLPQGSGLDLVRGLKQKNPKTGIIIISAKNSTDDKIEGLNIGADDYLSKPFDLAELNARIKALIRRRNFDGNKSIVVNEITLFPERRNIFVNDEEVILTTKEYDILLFLVSNKNKVVSKNSIAEHLSGDSADQMNNHDFIYVHLRNLRKKLAEKGCRDYIQTVYGIGYNFKTGSS
jgi:DNA-binding response OmpR family regulator